MFFYQRLDGNYFNYIIIAFVIMCTVFLFPIIGKYIDYKMDFVIVVPNSIVMYDQGGIFKRNTVTISSYSVKTISIKKSGLLYSMFDNGDIIILTEGDAEHNGEVVLRRVPRPEKRKNQMVKIIGIDVDANQNPQI
ncbi:MAG: PH domain-containing protein [candidate division SR1 bacterium]|nr:PH domain-containing protein [candidate division SR1 bacterium]